MIRRKKPETMSNQMNLSNEETTLLNYFKEEYTDLFEEILLLTEKPFLAKMTENVRNLLKDKADTFSKLTYMKLTTLIKSENYIPDTKALAKIREMLLSFGKEDALGLLPNLPLNEFIPHCRKTSKAYHICGAEVVRPQATETDFVLCMKCRMIYKPEQIHLYCKECGVDYFSSILEEEEEYANDNEEEKEGEPDDYRPATWEHYHCFGAAYEKMKCPECRKILYYSQKNNMVECCSCDFNSAPNKLQWKCIQCKAEFSSNAKVYDPIIFKTIKVAVKNAIVDNKPARPPKLPCCAHVDLSKAKFQHKKDCDGMILDAVLDNAYVIACEKCQSVTDYSSHVWLCPDCGKGFKCEPALRKAPMRKYGANYYNGGQASCNGNGYSNGNGHSNGNHHDAIMRMNSNKLPQYQPYPLNGQNNNRNITASSSQMMNNHMKEQRDPRRDLQSNHECMQSQSTKNMRQLVPQDVKKAMMAQNKCQTQYKSTAQEPSYSTLPNTSISTNASANPLGGKQDPKRPTYKKMIEISNFECDEDEVEFRQKKMPTAKNMGPRNLPTFTPDLLSNNGKFHINFEIKENPIPSARELEAERKKKKNNKKNQIEPGAEFDPEDFVLEHQIGEGTFGKIYSAVYNKNNEVYAMKKIVFHSETEMNEMKKEYDLVMSLLNNNTRITLNLIKIFGTQYVKQGETTFNFYVLMEIANGDWEGEIIKRSETKSFYTQGELMNILKSLVKTFAILQKNKITHRDIKPQNILKVDDSYKICDFGEATITQEQEKMLQTIRGTELYMSPILFHGLKQKRGGASHNCFKSDVFSLGMCILLAASLSFHSLYDIRELTDSESINIVLVKYLIARYNNEFISILEKMLEFDEEERCDFIQLETLVRD